MGPTMLKLAILIWMTAGTTLAGIAIMVVLTVPALSAKDMQYIPIAAVVGFVVAIPIAYLVGKRIFALTAHP